MNRLQEIVISKAERSKELRTLVNQGLIQKIAPRIYTSNLEELPEKIIRRNWYRIVSELFGDAMLSHRSALERLPTRAGNLYLIRSYAGRLKLPGLTLHFTKGHPPLEDDAVFFENLRVAGLARAYLENLQRTWTNIEEGKTLSRPQLEEKIEAYVRNKGQNALNAVRDRAREIAVPLGMGNEFTALNQLITEMLGTGLSKSLVSPIARARVLGEPVDPDRISLFESVYEELVRRDFPEYPDQNKSQRAYRNFAFFESYFSNYIEGTEFTMEEAKQIIATSAPLPMRDEDSHDILGTYQITSNRHEMSLVPTTPDQLINFLKERHAILLSARPGKLPGEFKDKNNRAGTTEFVDKDLVIGTLKRAFEWYSLLQHPFAKATYMMFLVSEVHPFLDGNGRIARIMMNAELTAGNLAKIIIPTVYREDYMGALKKLSKQRDPDAYIRMLLRVWQFSSHVVHEDRDEMEKYFVASNAFLQPKEGYLIIKPDGEGRE